MKLKDFGSSCAVVASECGVEGSVVARSDRGQEVGSVPKHCLEMGFASCVALLAYSRVTAKTLGGRS